MADDGGLSKFQRRMNAIPKDVREAVKPALIRQANQIATTARALAPEDSGDLKASIEVTGPGQQTPAYSQPGGSSTVGSNQAAVTAGNSDVRYAHLVEYGHGNGFGGSTVPAKPFFWPAVRMHRKKAAQSIKSAISRAIKKSKKP
ncbi:HK97-gp10 family putative phage morphogenesis protein [Thioclava sp. GXIMD4215]|uniref:HK97-gp10 family putative phage morphogenesis protein n=1 Tax=Thioclava sp. GXIMD4215 TaxID=3131928 RepID=UPI003247D076